VCRQTCRAGVSADCSDALATCHPVTNDPMFGVCCGTGGC
jgi:hypothetical protein